MVHIDLCWDAGLNFDFLLDDARENGVIEILQDACNPIDTLHELIRNQMADPLQLTWSRKTTSNFWWNCWYLPEIMILPIEQSCTVQRVFKNYSESRDLKWCRIIIGDGVRSIVILRSGDGALKLRGAASFDLMLLIDATTDLTKHIKIRCAKNLMIKWGFQWGRAWLTDGCLRWLVLDVLRCRCCISLEDTDRALRCLSQIPMTTPRCHGDTTWCSQIEARMNGCRAASFRTECSQAQCQTTNGGRIFYQRYFWLEIIIRCIPYAKKWKWCRLVSTLLLTIFLIQNYQSRSSSK